MEKGVWIEEEGEHGGGREMGLGWVGLGWLGWVELLKTRCNSFLPSSYTSLQTSKVFAILTNPATISYLLTPMNYSISLLPSLAFGILSSAVSFSYTNHALIYSRFFFYSHIFNNPRFPHFLLLIFGFFGFLC